jgi:hypothetical protein
VASAQTELRATAFSYALLGALFFAFGVMLIAFSWTGSWSRLWHAVGADCSSVASFGATAILLWVLAALSLRFLALNRIWQLATFAASLLIALWNIGGAVRQTLHPFVVSIGLLTIGGGVRERSVVSRRGCWKTQYASVTSPVIVSRKRRFTRRPADCALGRVEIVRDIPRA